MDIDNIPIISVSYNSPDLIENLLFSVRDFYANPITIIDGSDAEFWPSIEAVCQKYPNVRAIHFEYNIHHGPGIAWALQNLGLDGPVLVLDSDVVVLQKGLLESLAEQLQPKMYGVGQVNYVNQGGFDLATDAPGGIRYLHPVCMLVNADVARQWPMPIKHGSPMIETMRAIHQANQHDLISHVAWLDQDLKTKEIKNKKFLHHDFQGTFKRTGGYHLDDWSTQITLERVQGKTPETFNRDLLAIMPLTANRIIDIGCGHGAFAHAYKNINPTCHYIGIESNPELARSAHRICDALFEQPIESLNADFYKQFSDADIWVLSETLAKLRDPWDVLRKIRHAIKKDSFVVLSLPNSQHWSLQLKINIGDWNYEDSGLLDRSYLRFFTRNSMLKMFSDAGFSVAQAQPIIFGALSEPQAIAAIKGMAAVLGANPEQVYLESLPLQYIFKLKPQ